MKRTTLQQLDELIAKELNYSYHIVNPPAFTTDYFAVQELISHIVSDPLLGISTWLNKKSSWVAIYNFDKRWVGYCGVDENGCKETIDSTINSLPLAICLAFLKYKNIKVELEEELT